jgi:hypothetical protein
MGVYRTAAQEGMVNIVHCLGDDMLDITQDLRVKKSNAMHRVQKRPLLYFEDVRPDEPQTPKSPKSVKRSARTLASTGKMVEGLLSALSAAKKKNDKEALENRRAKQLQKLALNTGAAEHLHLVQEGKRQHLLMEHMYRVHDTTEFHHPRLKELFGLLREQ